MKTRFTLLSLLAIIAMHLSSFAQQNLVVPKRNLMAFDKQTRQKDGNPGGKYWQNTSDYFIKARVDVKNKRLSGHEKIVYYNNSPDSLKSLVIRLYQDVFKKGVNRNTMSDINPLDIHDGVNIESLLIDNMNVDSTLIKRQGTNMIIRLLKPVSPLGKVELEIAWNFKFPEHTLIRMGTIDSTSMFVAQWYPQIAVYDDIYGWDTRSYNGMSEFYNDFANFDVEITVPHRFMVWATGDLTNIDELLQPEVLKRYKDASISENVIHVITETDIKEGNITTSNNVWKYKANNVSDFAFGLSDHYLWDVTSVIVDKSSNRRTVVGAAYNKNAIHYDKVIDIARETVKYLSEEMPGIPYPFPYITAFHGDFGMEYPMITNVGPDQDFGTTVYAHSHEIAHAYFPFYVGTNETKNGWLDEGLIVFLPEKIQTILSPGFDIAKTNTAGFSHYAGMEDEPALITATHYLDPKVYFIINYAKTEQALRMLEIELGKDVFKKCLLAFMDRWKYKHPTPIDFFNTFNDVSQQDLNWYWNAWYYQTSGIPDLAIVDVFKNGKEITVTVQNKGDIPLPSELSFYNNDKLVKTITEPAKRWINNQNQLKVILDINEPITHVLLSSDIIPDANRKDNEYYLSL